MTQHPLGWLDEIKQRRRYPGGWRDTTQPNKAEKASIRALLEMQRRKQENGKPHTVTIKDVVYGRIHHLQITAGSIDGGYVETSVIDAFLRGNKDVARKRIRWGLYYDVVQFRKLWRKRRRGSR